MTVDPSVVSARAMIMAGRPHGAIPLLLARLERDATDAQALSLLGMAFSMAGNHGDARLFASRAAQLAPTDEQILATLAVVTEAAAAGRPATAAAMSLADVPATPKPPTATATATATEGAAPPPRDNADLIRELAVGYAVATRAKRHRNLWRMSAAGAITTLAAVAYLVFRLSRQAAKSTNDDRQFTLIIVAVIAVACIGAAIVATRWYLGLRRAPAEMRQAIALERQRRRSRLVAGGLVVVLALVVGGALMASQLVQSGLTAVTELTAGTCFMQSTGDTVPRVRTTACSEAHDSEILGTIGLESLGSVYPGSVAVERYALSACQAPFGQYVGRPYRASGDTLWLTSLTPQQSYWDQGIRTAWCVAKDGHGRRLAYSVRGAADR
jgi:hypothetical protein